MTDIPNMIRTIRAETGLSQVGFGAALGIPRRTIEQWESGDRKCPPYVVDLIAYRVRHDDSLRNDKNEGNSKGQPHTAKKPEA